MAAISKYALTFQNRLISFEQDIELVDIICSAQDKRDFSMMTQNSFDI